MTPLIQVESGRVTHDRGCYRCSASEVSRRRDSRSEKIRPAGAENKGGRDGLDFTAPRRKRVQPLGSVTIALRSSRRLRRRDIHNFLGGTEGNIAALSRKRLPRSRKQPHPKTTSIPEKCSVPKRRVSLVSFPRVR